MNYGGHLTQKQEREAVAKGAKLLDRILPGWHDQVNLDELKMRDGSMCMMGQLFGTNVEGDLATEMYPEEIAKARKADGDYGDGYTTALYAGPAVDGERGAVWAILRKLRIKTKMQSEYRALKHVCSGHDNTCLWAEAVAERKAKDAAAKGETVSA